MNRLLKFTCFMISCSFLFWACGSDTQGNSAGAAEEGEVAENTKDKPVVPSGNGRTYKMTLDNMIRGNWRSNDDPKRMWVFSDDQLIQMYNNKLVETVKFAVHENCSTECLAGEEAERGLNCLTITDKKSETCYLVLELDQVKLRYRLPNSKEVLSFKRM